MIYKYIVIYLLWSILIYMMIGEGMWTAFIAFILSAISMLVVAKTSE